MLYREYGQTGKKVSLLSFGGMRFANIDNHDECVRTMLVAAEGGVNYFDTASGYFEGRSETVFGKAFAEFRRKKLPYYSATKTFASKPDAIRREIEAQLKRMDISAIDFYHIWCINSLDNWKNRKEEGALQTFRELKEEGLIRHICVSSHLVNDEIRELLMEGVFEGVLFGYSAYNFQTREAAFDAVKEKKLGAVVMNPLGGGTIPHHPKRFDYLQRPNEGIVASALRFLWDHADITSTLVGFQTAEQVQDVLAAMEGYQPRTEAELAEVKSRARAALEGICTGCAYCVRCAGEVCSHGVPIHRFMDAYNQKFFNEEGRDDPVGHHLRHHIKIERSLAEKCTACGECEEACTQHINIIERLREIATLR